MKFLPTKIPDVIEIQPQIHGDERGYFMETYQQRHFEELNITANFVQDNQSRSVKNTLRGLHYQIKQPQGKLVRVISGQVFDVAVDMRKASPTFGQWVGVTLCEEKNNQLWVPPGFAHGFFVLSESATFVYKCSDYYAPEHERSLLWNDPKIGIDWPIQEGTPPLLSNKDRAGKPIGAAEVYE